VADSDGPGLARTGAALAAAFPGGVTAAFTGVIRYRKAYSAASNETIFALSAGSTAGGTNLLALRTNGTQAQLVTSVGAGTLTGTLVHDGSTINRIAYSVDPTYVGSERVTNGAFDAGLSNWTPAINPGWSSSGGVAAANSSGNAGLFQAGVFQAGKRYILSFDFVRTSGELNIWVDGTQIIQASVNTTGSKEIVVNAQISGSLFFEAVGSSVLSVDNVSVREVGRMSMSVNGAAAVETAGIAYTGAGVAALIAGSQTYSGTEPVAAMTVAAWDNSRTSYITGAALQALSA
jgi:hypothetical protein